MKRLAAVLAVLFATFTVAVPHAGAIGWTFFTTTTPTPSWPNDINQDPQPTHAYIHAGTAYNPDICIGLGSLGNGWQGQTYVRVEGWVGTSQSSTKVIDGADFTANGSDICTDAAGANLLRFTIFAKAAGTTCWRTMTGLRPWTSMALEYTSGYCPRPPGQGDQP